jgi:hypothetical protein
MIDMNIARISIFLHNDLGLDKELRVEEGEGKLKAVLVYLVRFIRYIADIDPIDNNKTEIKILLIFSSTDKKPSVIKPDKI